MGYFATNKTPVAIAANGLIMEARGVAVAVNAGAMLIYSARVMDAFMTKASR